MGLKVYWKKPRKNKYLKYGKFDDRNNNDADYCCGIKTRQMVDW